MTTVTLTYPIQAHGETVSEVTVRRPRVADLRLMEAATGPVSMTAALIGALCALTPKEVDQIDAADYQALAEVVGGFLPQRPPAGEA